MESKFFWNKKQIVTYVLSVFVLWIHCSSVLNYQNTEGAIDFIAAFFQHTFVNIAVPLFFIISGALFFRNYTRSLKCYKEKLARRTKTLIVPYLIWNTINMLFDIFATTFFSRFFVGRKAFEFSIENIIHGIFHYEYNIVFWFMFALIVFTVSAPLIDLLLYSKATGIISIAVLTALCYWNIGLPQPLFESKNCLVYYLVGGFIGRYCFDFFSKKSSLKQRIVSAAVLAAGIVYYYLVHYKLVVNHLIVKTVVLVILSLCLWSFFDFFVSDKTTAPKFTKHSFWVFAAHVNISAVFAKLIYIIFPKANYFGLINFALTTVLTLVAVEIICLIVEKISPKLYTVLSGGR